MNVKTFGFRQSTAKRLKRMAGMRESETPGFGPPPSSRGAKLTRFLLSSSLSTGTATGTVYQMDGTTEVESSATIEDPEGIFFILGSGDRGISITQDGKHYVVNAKCPGT
jgi:hypothetical protein